MSETWLDSMILGVTLAALFSLLFHWSAPLLYLTMSFLCALLVF